VCWVAPRYQPLIRWLLLSPRIMFVLAHSAFKCFVLSLVGSHVRHRVVELDLALRKALSRIGCDEKRTGLFL
jgi:hypothetical protein